MPQDINWIALAAQLIVVFFAIGLHEFAHAKVADMAGDPTPRYMGRVTLNLFKHFDAMGAIMILFTSISGFGIGWGKPVMVDPRKMKNPRWDHFASVAAGPLSNILQAGVWAIFFRVFHMFAPAFLSIEFVFYLLLFGVLTNLGVAFFNLIPLGPLDGHWLVGAFLPDPARYKWYVFNRSFGSMALLIVIFAGQASGFSITGLLVRPPVKFLGQHLLGIDLTYVL